MKIYVTAKPGAKENKIEKIDAQHFKVRVKARPDKGKANEAILELLADYLGCAKSKLTILRGHTAPQKVIEALIS